MAMINLAARWSGHRASIEVMLRRVNLPFDASNGRSERTSDKLASGTAKVLKNSMMSSWAEKTAVPSAIVQKGSSEQMNADKLAELAEQLRGGSVSLDDKSSIAVTDKIEAKIKLKTNEMEIKFKWQPAAVAKRIGDSGAGDYVCFVWHGRSLAGSRNDGDSLEEVVEP
jgi:hypothetical protein